LCRHSFNRVFENVALYLKQVEIFSRKWWDEVAVLKFRQHGDFYPVALASIRVLPLILTVKGVDAQAI